MATDFVRLLRNKYGFQDDLEVEPGIVIAVNSKVALHDLKVVDLSGSRLALAGSDGAIQFCCPNILELEISNTKIQDWSEIIKIISQLPVIPTQNLKYLGICGLHLNPTSFGNLTAVFPNIKTLLISGSHFSEVFPRLRPSCNS